MEDRVCTTHYNVNVVPTLRESEKNSILGPSYLPFRNGKAQAAPGKFLFPSLMSSDSRSSLLAIANPRSFRRHIPEGDPTRTMLRKDSESFQFSIFLTLIDRSRINEARFFYLFLVLFSPPTRRRLNPKVRPTVSSGSPVPFGPDPFSQSPDQRDSVSPTLRSCGGPFSLATNSFVFFRSFPRKRFV